MILKYLYTSKYPVVVIYDGASSLNGERIICFMYLKPSTNVKVYGAFYTAYIPFDADNNHHESVCGQCALKPFCFTRGYMQMSYYKWLKAYKQGDIPLIQVSDLQGFNIRPTLFRFGMHGDPASIPFEVTEQYLDYWALKGVKIIGYTHQKEHTNYDNRYDIFLASIESLAQKERIEGKTARVIAKVGDKQKDEVICPYDLEKEMNGYATITCGDCGLCSVNKKVNICFLPKKPTKKFIAFLEDAKSSGVQSVYK